MGKRVGNRRSSNKKRCRIYCCPAKERGRGESVRKKPILSNNSMFQSNPITPISYEEKIPTSFTPMHAPLSRMTPQHGRYEGRMLHKKLITDIISGNETEMEERPTPHQNTSSPPILFTPPPPAPFHNRTGQ